MLELVVWFWLFELIWLIDCLIVSLVDPLNWLTWSFELILWFESHAVLFWSDYVLILSPVYEFFNISFHFWWSFNISAWGENFIVWDMTWQHILWFVKFLHNVDIYTFIVYLLEEVWLITTVQIPDPRSQITNHRSHYITLKNWNNHTVIIRVIAFTPFLPDEKGEMYLSDG